MKSIFRSRQGWALVAGLALSLPVLMGQGCPSAGTDGNPDQGAPGGAPVVKVPAPSLNETLTVGDPVTLSYNVSSSGGAAVSAFYDQDGVPGSGDEVVFMSNLASGSNNYAQLATSTLAAGTYRVGVTATNSSGTRTVYAPAIVTLASPPQINFTSPTATMRVAAGVTIPVVFASGGIDFTWRLFYDTDGAVNGDETTIAEGSAAGGTTVQASFDTAALASGTYHLGVSVATVAGATATTYAPGSVTLISGAYIQVLLPTVGSVAPRGAMVQIAVAANAPGVSGAFIRLFYDPDNTYGNGNEGTIGNMPVSSSGTTWNTSFAPVGSYYVGAVLVNGMTPPLVSYSAGPVQITP